MNAFRDMQARTRHTGADLSEVLDDLLGELARRDEIPHGVSMDMGIAKGVKDVLGRALNEYVFAPIVDAQAKRSSEVGARIHTRPESEADALRKALAESEMRLGDAQAGEAYVHEVLESEADRLRKSLAEAERKVEAQRAEISRLTDKVQALQERLTSTSNPTDDVGTSLSQASIPITWQTIAAYLEGRAHG